MMDANSIQIERFKIKYCQSDESRIRIKNFFKVEIESFEELLPGISVKSYATGSRDINNAFVVFKVTDLNTRVVYHPVFSETVGRKLAKDWGLQMPSKMTVFADDGSGGGGDSEGKKGVYRKEENKKMLLLIQYARSMMILHISEPEPMKDPFRGIYNKLQLHPRYDVWEMDIKSINTAIRNFLNKSLNTKKENFSNLQGYIDYLQKQYPNRQLRNYDFKVLRDKLKMKYPDETIVF